MLALVPDKRMKLNEQKQENIKRKAYIQRLLGKEENIDSGDKEV